ncbi:hypothetical protein O3P69_001081 [Scylla paramamosain]|uniref:Uncharacterized protein n=1 Tax=Scylla paramamosain TaxID=85552 RepID=A0AAW0UNJ1_SCYPA
MWMLYIVTMTAQDPCIARVEDRQLADAIRGMEKSDYCTCFFGQDDYQNAPGCARMDDKDLQKCRRYK